MTPSRSRAAAEEPRVSAESLRWMMGFLCTVLGALVLVAPHRFWAPGVLTHYRGLWGVTALLSGVSLLAVAALRPRPEVRLLSHVLTGSTLLALATSFAVGRLWVSALTYILLGLGTALAGFLPNPDRFLERNAPTRDLFALLMGTAGTVNGTILLVWPALLAAAYFDSARPYLPWLGLAQLLGGVLLVYAHTRPAPSPRLLWSAHLAAGASLLAFGTAISLSQHAWAAVGINWAYAFSLALLPWLSARLARLDTAALRTRFALILATATSLALILTTALVTAQVERLAEVQVLATQGIEARAIARNVSDYVEMNGARTFAIAALAGRTPLTSEAQRRLLASSRRSYPDVTAFRTVALDGRVVAAAGEVAIPPQLLRTLAAEMRREPQPRLQLVPATVEEYSLLLLRAPIRGDDGGVTGLLVAAFDSAALARRIARPGSSVTLADGHGRLISAHNLIPGGSEVAPLPPGWDRRVGAGRSVARPDVASFAVVPRLGWAVAVERPRAEALAGVRRGRDLAFGLLLLVVPLAIVGGVAIARRIARPLGDLSSAVDELTAGNLAAPLGATSGVSEVARLSAAFREMRDRLAERTLESESLAAELRTRAETLAEIDRRKDEFLAMLAHELRNPLGAIANASYLLEQLGPADPQTERAVAIVRRQTQHLVRMVDDLLDVSRITRGKVELRRARIDLCDVVRNTVETTRPLAQSKQQTLREELASEPLPLDGDATRLEQVLANLLRNAIKFTEPGGSIDISVRRNGTAEALIVVRDDGAGITPGLLPRIFDLFAQGEQTLDRSRSGLGIGLTLVRRLVEMHGGRVEARSDGPGRGSEFEVRLPLAPSLP